MKYTIALVIHNNGKYLDKFFASLIGQDIGFAKHIEVIVVSSKTRGKTKSDLEKRVANHPQNIRCFYTNGGLAEAAARNIALKHASGQWAAFADPKDAIHKNYFSIVDRRLKKAIKNTNLSAVWTRRSLFDEKTQKASADPLFPQGTGNKTVVVDSASAPCFFQPIVASALFFLPHIRKHGLTFDERIPSPSAAETKFFIDLFAAEPASGVAFMPEAELRACTSKSAACASDQVQKNAHSHIETFKHGVYLPLRAAALRGEIPQTAKCPVLYETTAHLRRYTDEVSPHLSPAQKKEYLTLLQKTIDLLTPEDIVRFNASCSPRPLDEGLLAVLEFFFHKKGLQPSVLFKKYDCRQELACLHAYTHPEDQLEFFINDVNSMPAAYKKRSLFFMGHEVATRHIAWLPYAFDSDLRAEADGKPLTIACRDKSYDSLTPQNKPVPVAPQDLPWRVRFVRRVMRLPFIRNGYKNCWLFIDRDFVADDNAEHFYRWVQKHDPKRPIRFLLNKNSPDWNRLKKDGFKLVRFGSLWHYILLSSCEWLFSSNAPSSLFRPFFKKYYGDLARYKFCFLQHGITKDDVSRWFNKRPIDLLVTAARREYLSIVQNPAYAYTAQEVRLTGFPRHDALLEKAEGDDGPKCVLVAPTWRSYLAGELAHKITSARLRSDALLSSRFFAAWRDALHDERLRQAAEKNGLRLVFMPHPEIAVYAKDFVGKSGVPSLAGTVRYQDALSQCALLLTDYSSVAMEIGFLKRPVVYYQFDREEFFASHSYRSGYFSYPNDGFGAIVQTHDELVEVVVRHINSGCLMEDTYRKRADAFFTYRDRGSCKRVYDAAVEASKKYVPKP